MAHGIQEHRGTTCTLPCGGCKHCVRAHTNWERFYNDVDDIVPLAIRHVSHNATDKVPKDDLTWVEIYRVEDLQKMQLDDEITSQLIKWLESDQKPTHAELALCSPGIKYFCASAPAAHGYWCIIFSACRAAKEGTGRWS